MPIKIFGQVEEKIEKLIKEGYVLNYISKETGLSGGTITSWAGRKGLNFGNYRNPELRDKELKFVELIRSGYIMKHACKELDIYDSTGISWAQRNNLGSAIRSRAEAAQDKLISFEEAKSRLPEGHGTITHYDPENKVYVIKREDGTTYNRILSQIFRGDPKKGEKARIEESDAAKILLDLGYRLILGTFRIKREPVEAEHIVCGYIRRNVLAQYSKQDCPRCSNTGTSKEEMELDEFVKSLGVSTNKFRFPMDYRGKGKGKEIDIFIKELDIGIEYCGFYRHGELETLHSLQTKLESHTSRGKIYEPTDFDSPRLRHKAKMDKAEKIGIRLITVFEHEWKKKKDIVEAVLRAKLHKNEFKIFARDTEVRKINKKEAKNFLERYHLQGASLSIICFGLFHNNELVAVITGGHHHRINGKFVLNRLCFKANTTIVGGSSKLNNALENWAKSNGIDEIVSWSDNRWSDGGVYKALGYIKGESVNPDHFYFDSRGRIYSKQSCQKRHLTARGGIGDTEWKMAQSLKLDRIFDCGKKTWVKKLI